MERAPDDSIGYPPTSSNGSRPYADEGSAAHQVLEECLRMTYQIGIPAAASDYVGSTRRVEDGPHGRLSPSGAKRWMTCAGAPSMEAMFPEEEQPPREIPVTDEMAAAVQQALDYVEMRCGELRDAFGIDAAIEVIPERKVSPVGVLGTHDCDGTSDITITVEVGGAVVYIEQADYKHGAGVPVSVDDPQNQLYLLGTICELHTPEFTEIPVQTARCTIIQPRCDKMEPRIRWRDIEDAKDWYAGFVPPIRSALASVQDADADEDPVSARHLAASEDGCRFCNAKGACSEYTRFAMSRMGVIEDAPLPDDGGVLYEACEDFARRDNRLLTAGQIVAILSAKDILVGALQAVEAHAQQMLENGTAPMELQNRYKLVAKRTRRTWGIKDPTELERRLKKLKAIDTKTGKLRGLGKKDIYVTKMDSVTGVEKTLKAMTTEKMTWAAFRELVYKPEGDLVIAPISDPRDAVDPTPTSPEDVFADAPGAPPVNNDEEKNP